MKTCSIQLFLLFLFTLYHSAFCSNSVLLVIDMQKGLLDTNSFMHVQNSMINNVVNNVNDNIQTARQNNIPVIFIRNEWSNYFQNLFTGNVCKTGSKEAEIDDRINIVDSLLFIKNEPNTFSNKMFCKYLIENKIDTIYIEGIMAEACVYATAKNGMKRRMKVIILEDAIGSASCKKKEKMVRKYLKENMEVQKKMPKAF